MSKRTITSLVIAIIVIAGAGIWYASYRHNDTDDAASNNSAATASQNSAPAEAIADQNSPANAGGTGTAATKSKQQLYDEALLKYPNRFQFTIECQATPGFISVKKGTSIMLDNRGSASHKIAVAGKTYVIAGYDYAIIPASTIGNNNLTCDGGGTAKLNVE